MRRRLAGLALCALLSAAPAADLHRYWDNRCRDCHGDAGDFARRTLHLERGRLAGKHHRENLEVFLRNHYLADDLVEPVMAMLMSQVATRPLFRERCAACHGSASDFARRSLALRADTLVGKAGGRPVAEYLRTHGGLAPEEIAAMTQTLRRVLAEVGTK